MRAIVHHEDSDAMLTIFLFHGSTQPFFDKFHPLVELFSAYPFNVVSVELPGHGKSPFDKKVDVNELIDIFTTELKERVRQWDAVALCGYSLGGSLAFKALECGITRPEFIITFGTGFVLGEEEISLIRMFFSDSFFESLGWKAGMERIHQDWKHLIDSIADWYYPESPLLPNLDYVKQSQVPVLSILGDDDEPFPAAKNIPPVKDVPNVTVRSIKECGHFDYFSKAWPQVRNEIITFLQHLGYHPRKKK